MLRRSPAVLAAQPSVLGRRSQPEESEASYIQEFIATAYTGSFNQFALVAVDRFGNRGANSTVLSGATKQVPYAVYDRDAWHGWSTGYADSIGGGVIIDRDVTWGPAIAKTFVVKGNLRIQPGATLTLLPGTVIKFEHPQYPQDGSGPFNYADGAITVHEGATLVSQGTAAKPVVLTKTGDDSVGLPWPADDYPAINENWWGIETTTGSNVQLSHTQLRLSDHGVAFCSKIGTPYDPCGS